MRWLLGKLSQKERSRGVSTRTWRRQVSWCKEIVPKPGECPTAHHTLILDGIRVGSLLCLITRTTDYVVSWYWADRETSSTWREALEIVPAPQFIVCDGQKGMLKTLAPLYPKTKLQRCYFHIWLNMKKKLTLHPQTRAGMELLRIVKDLHSGKNKIQTRRQMRKWKRRFKRWERKHLLFVQERTYHKNPTPGQQRWWYTHSRVRSAYWQLKRLLDQNQLFTHIRYANPKLPRTTNHLEGGINSLIRDKIRHHRGLKQVHQQRLVDWYLYSKTKDQKPPRFVL